MLTIDVSTEDCGTSARQVIEDALDLCRIVNVRIRIDKEVVVDRSTTNSFEVATKLSRALEKKAKGGPIDP